MAEESPWRKWVRTCGARYFEGLETEIAALRLPVSHSPPSFELVEVATPEWIAELGASAPSAIPVDRSCIIDGTGPAHTRCDWWKAAFLMLSAAYERDHEAKYGPVHSYRLRLPAAWEPMFRRPWANWIFLMLARQAAGRQIPIPRAEFHLTHDVDAIAKTLPTRLKQATFHTLNSGRSLVQGRVNTSIRTFGKALRMAFAPGDYWQFDRILSMEKERGFWSTWNFYGGKGGWGRSPRHILMDPMYDVSSPALRQLLRRISGEGWHIGLHQAYDSWDNPEPMRIEAEAVSTASGVPITCCRQHWLRFSFEKTWKAQSDAGIRLDTTIGFNDSWGFRLSAALDIHPWDEQRQRPHDLVSRPMVLMDSHLHDYSLLEENEIRNLIDHIVSEVAAVGGVASLLWHQRIMHPDYGWDWSYQYLLDRLLADGHLCI